MSFAVCPSCEGRGSSSAYLGAFTSDELHAQGEDFIEDYSAGNYDRPCATCQGQRVVTACDTKGCSLPVLTIAFPWGAPATTAHCEAHLTAEEEATAMDASASWTEAQYEMGARF